MMLRKPSSVPSTTRSLREVVSGGAYTEDFATARPGFLDRLAAHPSRTGPLGAGCFAGVALALSFTYCLFAVFVMISRTCT